MKPGRMRLREHLDGEIPQPDPTKLLNDFLYLDPEVRQKYGRAPEAYAAFFCIHLSVGSSRSGSPRQKMRPPSNHYPVWKGIQAVCRASQYSCDFLVRSRYA
jgi:hypothetical protein